MRRFLYWITAKLPTRYINHDGHPYLERSYLCDILGVRVYIHRFVASDPAGVHDHPFLYSWSFILANYYLEERWAKQYVRRWFNRIGPNDFHRVVLPDNKKDVWTIFMHTKRVKPWGFMRPLAVASTESSFINPHSVQYLYSPESEIEDPAQSNWHLIAPSGAVLRKTVRQILLGLRCPDAEARSSLPSSHGSIM